MALKLVQVKQSELINQIFQSRKIVLNDKNNTWNVPAGITNKRYTHIFTNPEIALSQKFISNILDQGFFINCFYLLVIDNIHPIEKWDKNSQHVYAIIKKV